MSLVDQLRPEHPIVQAGMGGGVANAALAGSVSAAGALGIMGILPAGAFGAALARARERVGGAPVAANLLITFAARAHAEACGKARVQAVVLHAGFKRQLVDQLRGDGVIVLHTVGTRTEAKRALAEGADGLVVQGLEAGGHPVGVGPAQEALERVREISGSRPIVLAGGIADAADVLGPSSPLADMPDSVVQPNALYAGETALRIDSLVSAAEGVKLLAGRETGRGSPTMPST